MNIESILAQFPEGVFSEEDKTFIKETTKSAYAFNDLLQKKNNCTQQEAEGLLKLFISARIEIFVQEMVNSDLSENEIKELVLTKIIDLTGEFATQEGFEDVEKLKKDSLTILKFFETKFNDLRDIKHFQKSVKI
jgi:hypothetical protein